MVKLPEAMGLILCEDLAIEATSRRVSLRGVFISRRFSAFPAQSTRFMVYAALFDARVEAEMRLTCTRLETEEDLYYNSKWYSFPSPGRISLFTMFVGRMEFPAPGRDAWTLLFDGQPITTSYLDVMRE
jgi:hypothetical protein